MHVTVLSVLITAPTDTPYAPTIVQAYEATEAYDEADILDEANGADIVGRI